MQRRWRAIPAGFHSTRWARAYHAVGARRARPRARRSRRRSPRASGPTSPRSTQVAAGPTTRTPRPRRLDDAVGDRLVIVRSDRIEPSKNIVRGFLAYDRLLEARPGLRGRVVFVAMLYPSRADAARVPRVRERDRAGRRARQRPLGDARLDADPARRARRLPALDRGDAALRRAAREPDQGRAQPRREGRPGGQPARRSALPLARGRRVGRACAAPRSRCIRSTSKTRPARSTARSRRRSTSGRRSRRSCATLATARTPSDWVADLVAHATASRLGSARRASARSRPRRAASARPIGSVDETRRPRPAARRASRPTAHRSAPRGAAGRRSRPAPSAANAARSPVSSPANAATAKPVDQRVDRGALVDRDRRPQLHREPAGQLREPVPARRARRRRSSTSSARSGAVRQCNVTLTPPCARRSHPGGGASASSAAAATAVANGSTRGSTRRSPSTSDSMPYRPTKTQAGHGEPAREELDRPAAHDPDPPDPAHEARPAHRSRPGSATASSGRSTIGAREPS